MDYVEKARALRADPAVHYNCCQAVQVTFADRLGLTPEQANALGAHFGSGMRHGSTCGAVSGALEAEKLILLSDIKGLYRDINDEDSFIPEINCDKVKEYIEDGTIAGGMIPKMQCCVDAIQKGAREVVIIDGRVEHSLLIEIFTHSGSGTMVTK